MSRILITDVGGVLLSNGLDTPTRNRAADHFKIDREEMQVRHEMVFEDYERGKLFLEEYLQHVVFYTPRDFTLEAFQDYLLESSVAYPEMIQLYRDLKANCDLKIFTLSNEGREIADYRFQKFNFDPFIDAYLVSGYVGYRKPDLRMFQLGLALGRQPADQIIYIDDRLNLVDIAKGLGMQAIHHVDYPTTKAAIVERFLN